MANKLVNFAFAKSIYSEKKNYLDTFMPFVIKILDDDKSHKLTDIELALKSEYELKIPANTLKSILSNLSNKNLILLNKKNHYESTIASAGKEFISRNIESEKIIRRKILEFWKGFCDFSKVNYNTVYIKDNDENKLFQYLDENVVELIEHTLGNGLDSLRDNSNSDFAKHLSHYICDIEQDNHTQFEIFQEILKGSILWNEIAKKENVEKEADFDNLVIYLDSNYFLNLANLDSPFSYKCAQQLYELLRSNNKVILRIFSISLEEVKRLLVNYKNQMDSYTSVPVHDIYFFLKSNQYDVAKIDLFIANLARTCRELGIAIDDRASILEVSALSGINKELYDDLYKKNMESNNNQQHNRSEEAIYQSTIHDVSIIDYIRKKRGSWIANFESSKYVFLTSSNKLYNVNRKLAEKHGHYPETILDVLLTNILWLKNPKDDVGCSIQQVISIHSKNMFVEHKIWKKFIHTLKELRESDKINDNDYAHLISNNQTSEYLKNSDADKITNDNILNLLDQIMIDKVLDNEDKKSKNERIKEQSAIIGSKQQEITKLKHEISQFHTQIEIKSNENSELKDKIINIEAAVQKIELDKRRSEFINTKVEADLIQYKSEAYILLKYTLIIIGLNILISLVNDIKPQIPLLFSLISNILIIGGGVITRKFSAKNFQIVFERLFRKKLFLEKLRVKYSKEFDTTF